MFETLVTCSEAVRQSAQAGAGALIPALSGCRTCGKARLISAPILGTCLDCGTDLVALPEHETWKAVA
jgi:hypothetical protein